jgi:predicted DNA-binding transcriptional regulator AlpA
MAAMDKDLLNEHQVAQRLGLSVATIRRFRLLRRGPKYLKVSSAAVRYRPEDVEIWLTSRPSGGAGILASGSTTEELRLG